jgi:hypothetical protein
LRPFRPLCASHPRYQSGFADIPRRALKRVRHARAVRARRYAARILCAGPCGPSLRRRSSREVITVASVRVSATTVSAKSSISLFSRVPHLRTGEPAHKHARAAGTLSNAADDEMMVFLSHNGTPINGANHHVTPSVGVPVDQSNTRGDRMYQRTGGGGILPWGGG